MNFSDDGDLRPRAYDLIVFDWDGTLFDSTALIVRSIQLACEDKPEQAAVLNFSDVPQAFENMNSSYPPKS